MILVGIPTIGLSYRLRPLVTALLSVPDVTVRLVCNRDGEDWERVHQAVEHVRRVTSGVGMDRVSVHPMVGAGIYEVWNDVIDVARAHRADSCVILNDDIWIHPESVVTATRVLHDGAFAHPGGRVAPVGIVGWDPAAAPGVPDGLPLMAEVSGTYRENGITGFAFAVHPARDEFVGCDTSFGWWGGDDDLVWSIIAANRRAVKMVGVGVVHDTSTSSTQRPEVLASIEHDRERLRVKWGRTF
jgi:hypothetical protein